MYPEARGRSTSVAYHLFALTSRTLFHHEVAGQDTPNSSSSITAFASERQVRLYWHCWLMNREYRAAGLCAMSQRSTVASLLPQTSHYEAFSYHYSPQPDRENGNACGDCRCTTGRHTQYLHIGTEGCGICILMALYPQGLELGCQPSRLLSTFSVHRARYGRYSIPSCRYGFAWLSEVV
jgi:hypothetical protein